MNQKFGLLAGLAIVGAALWLFLRGRSSAPQVLPRTIQPRMKTTGTGVFPSSFGFGGQRQQPQIQATNAPPAWASIVGPGINALGGLARDWFNRRANVNETPSTAPGRVVNAPEVAVPSSIGPGIPVDIDAGEVQSFDLDSPMIAAPENNGWIV